MDLDFREGYQLDFQHMSQKQPLMNTPSLWTHKGSIASSFVQLHILYNYSGLPFFFSLFFIF